MSLVVGHPAGPRAKSSLRRTLKGANNVLTVCQARATRGRHTQSLSRVAPHHSGSPQAERASVWRASSSPSANLERPRRLRRRRKINNKCALFSLVGRPREGLCCNLQLVSGLQLLQLVASPFFLIARLICSLLRRRPASQLQCAARLARQQKAPEGAWRRAWRRAWRLPVALLTVCHSASLAGA